MLLGKQLLLAWLAGTHQDLAQHPLSIKRILLQPFPVAEALLLHNPEDGIQVGLMVTGWVRGLSGMAASRHSDSRCQMLKL